MRVFDLPEVLPVIAVAARGPQSARIATELGDGLFAVEPDGGLISTWRDLGGDGPADGEMPLAWAQDEDSAVCAVLEKNSFALAGWKVMSELPNPVNFEAVTASVTPGQVREQFACGPDPDGFMDFFASELAAPLRALTAAPRRRPATREAS